MGTMTPAFWDPRWLSDGLCRMLGCRRFIDTRAHAHSLLHIHPPTHARTLPPLPRAVPRSRHCGPYFTGETLSLYRGLFWSWQPPSALAWRPPLGSTSPSGALRGLIALHWLLPSFLPAHRQPWCLKTPCGPPSSLSLSPSRVQCHNPSCFSAA